MHFSLRQLEVFCAVACHENVSRAARQLAMSQSAASTALGELERQFDCQLFDRRGKRLTLNGLGRKLLPQAMGLLDQAQAVEGLLRHASELVPLRLGATLTIGNYLAPLLIGQFMQQQPASQISLQVHNTAQIIDQIARYELDLGLIEGECLHAEVERLTWIEDALCVFCAPHHPLAQPAQATLDELSNQPWILREPGSGTRLTFDQAMHHHRGALDIRLELEHTEAIKRAVASGLGIGCLSQLALRGEFQQGSLCPIATPLDLRRHFHFIWHRHKHQSTTQKAFIYHCQQLTRGLEHSAQIGIPGLL